MAEAVLRGKETDALRVVGEYQEIFGKENYFIEIQCHPSVENDKPVRENLIALAKKHGVDVVATQDSHYPCTDDHEAHNTLLQINTQGDNKEGARFEFSNDDFSFMSTEKALEVFKDAEESCEAVTNTMKIADMCNLELELGKWVFPDFKIEAGKTYAEKLRELTYAGFERLKLKETPEIKARVE